MSEKNPQLLKILEDVTRRCEGAIRYVTGRSISLAELGAIREQVWHALQLAYLRGKLARHNMLADFDDPWDLENEVTTPWQKNLQQSSPSAQPSAAAQPQETTERLRR